MLVTPEGEIVDEGRVPVTTNGLWYGGGSADSAFGLWRLEKILGWPEKVLEFHIWYLKEKGWIQHTDTGGYAINAAGVDIVEEHNLIVSEDRLLPYNRKKPEDDGLVEKTVINKKSGMQLTSKKV